MQFIEMSLFVVPARLLFKMSFFAIVDSANIAGVSTAYEYPI